MSVPLWLFIPVAGWAVFTSFGWLRTLTRRDTRAERPGSDDQWRSFPTIGNPALGPRLNDQTAADESEARDG